MCACALLIVLVRSILIGSMFFVVLSCLPHKSSLTNLAVVELFLLYPFLFWFDFNLSSDLFELNWPAAGSVSKICLCQLNLGFPSSGSPWFEFVRVPFSYK